MVLSGAERNDGDIGAGEVGAVSGCGATLAVASASTAGPEVCGANGVTGAATCCVAATAAAGREVAGVGIGCNTLNTVVMKRRTAATNECIRWYCSASYSILGFCALAKNEDGAQKCRW